MSTIFAIANQKGGVGKTTSAVTLGSGLALRGYRVLAVDLDPQGHICHMLNIPKSDGVKRWFYDGEQSEKVIVKARENLWILPGDKTTDRVVGMIRDESYGEETFAHALHTTSAAFDVLMLDMAPSLNIMQVAGLMAADHILIPTRLRFTDMDGVQEVIRSLRQVEQHDHKKRDYFVLPTFFDRITSETTLRLRELVTAFGTHVWPPIMQDVKLAEAPGHGQTIWDYAPACNAVLGYRNGNGRRVGGYAQAIDRLISIIEKLD